MTINFILFDLDETLYPRENGLMQEIGRLIRLWLQDRLGLKPEQAATMQRDYFARYGTTLNGLIVEKRVDARDYLSFVHDIPVETYLKPDPALAAMLVGLPLRRVIYTNATQEYSWRVLRELGVSDCFERVVGIEDVGLRNKWYRESYERVLELLSAGGEECIMVEDSHRNLRAAKALGMTTILVGKDGSTGLDEAAQESVDFALNSILDVGPIVHNLLNL
jgi:putative hydrolase of the HAD superfamily